MQGDIRQPKLRPKPKPDKNPPIPDFTIDEAGSAETAEPAKQPGGLLIAPHKHFIRFWRWWMGLNRNTRFGIVAGVLLVFGVLAIVWFTLIQPNSNPELSLIRHPKPQPKTVASPLTGVQVDPALATRPVTAVMIENSTDARPQSGLQDAGVVYEAIAEGGVTRFMALFQEAKPQYVGPVRSLRPYYIDFAQPFQASIAHVGGSPDALKRVRNGNYRDIDQFFNAGYYWRITSRAAPHNVYTSFAKLDSLNKSKGYKHSKFSTWPRKPDNKLATPKVRSIDILISGPEYYVHYDYDPATNTYLRSEASERHLDITNSKGKLTRLHPKVVIALVMGQSSGALDASGAYYTDYDDTGSGRAVVFQDGRISKILWKKATAGSQIQFFDSTGQPFKLDAGQTWLTLIGSNGLVRYSAK